MKKYIIITLVALVFASCGGKYKFWDISEFNMDSRALEDNEEIKILYFSQGPDDNEEKEYYMQLVVVSQKTGDTVNILTTVNHYLTMDDKDKVFNFFNQDNFATKIGQMDLKNIDDLKHIDDLANQPTQNITKVARDPEFDFVADNDYPTIIGSMGVTTETGK